MKLPSWVKVSAPTKSQLQHDAWLVVTAFVGTAFAAWQLQPNKLSKAGLIAAGAAGIAAAVTVLKSIFTTL
jgi:hypothetical protein